MKQPLKRKRLSNGGNHTQPQMPIQCEEKRRPILSPIFNKRNSNVVNVLAINIEGGNK